MALYKGGPGEEKHDRQEQDAVDPENDPGKFVAISKRQLPQPSVSYAASQ